MADHDTPQSDRADRTASSPTPVEQQLRIEEGKAWTRETASPRADARPLGPPPPSDGAAAAASERPAAESGDSVSPSEPADGGSS